MNINIDADINLMYNDSVLGVVTNTAYNDLKLAVTVAESLITDLPANPLGLHLSYLSDDQVALSRKSTVDALNVLGTAPSETLCSLWDGIPYLLDVPAIGTTWAHGGSTVEYVVTGVTNKHSNLPTYPLTIVYKGVDGKVWSRPYSKWHRSMNFTR